MSTLTTRIAGYKFEIAPLESGKFLGQFDSENGDGMALPFELRSCYESVSVHAIFNAAHEAITTLTERVVYTSEFHEDCDCESCKISLGMLDREYGKFRGNQWKMTQRNYTR